MTREPQTDTAEAARRPLAAAAAGTRSWVANALVAVLVAGVTVTGGGFAALLVYAFNSIDSRFDSIEARFDALETRFNALEEGQDEIARTLTALVAELNARAAVDAALAGRLVTPDSAGAAEPGSAEP